MTSKYAQVLKERTLPKLLAEDDEDPKYQDKVEAEKTRLKEQYPDLTATKLAGMFVMAREAKKPLEARVKEANLRLTAISQLLGTAYETEDITSLTIKDGKTVRKDPDIVAKVTDPWKFREWCLKDEDIAIKMTLNHMTRNGICKDRLLNGLEDPDGIELKVRDKFVVS